MLVCLLPLLHFASLSHHFICFFASSYLQMSCLCTLFTIFVRRILSYNPPVRKGAFESFNHFLIQPPFAALALEYGRASSHVFCGVQEPISTPMPAVDLPGPNPKRRPAIYLCPNCSYRAGNYCGAHGLLQFSAFFPPPSAQASVFCF